jgi:DNA-binding MarR family transcriptional regulator
MGQKPSPEDLVRECVALGGLLRRAVAEALAPYGITPEQHELLALLASGRSSPSAILEASGRDKTTLSRAVARAAKAGLVTHERSTSDRRRQVLRLTPHGAAVLEQTRGLVGRLSPKLVGGLTPKERRRLSKIARKLQRGLAGV